MNAFRDAEYTRQAAFLKAIPGATTGYQGHAVMVDPADLKANFDPVYADRIDTFFSYRDSGSQSIDWHTRSNHGASSQVCCVNFLFPMVDQPVIAARWVEHVLTLDGVTMEVIDRRCGEDCFVTFEWFPPEDYLNEANAAGVRPRGSNSTSVDAAMCFTIGGERHLLLIEWKYTEAYGASRDRDQAKGDATRDRRYGALWQRPHGPIRADAAVELADFYLNPWYQLLRQQMLAYHCEADPLSGYDRVTVLHISPDANLALKRSRGVLAAKTGESDLIAAFTALLHPGLRDRFKAVDTGRAFAPLLSWPDVEWAGWLAGRYASLLPRD